MNKKKQNRAKHHKPFIVLVVGIVALLLSPLVFRVMLEYVHTSSTCPSGGEFDLCSSLDFTDVYTSFHIALAWGAVSAIVIGVGLYLRYRRKRGE